MTMMRFARLTLVEAYRRRILFVLAGLTLASVALVGWGTERLVSVARADGVNEIQIRIGVSQILVFIAFMFSFVLAMTAAFLAAPAVAGDVESGVALAVLARPVRRGSVIVGRWLGLSIVVAGYAAASGLLAIGVVRLVSGYAPPQPLVAIAYVAGQSIVVLTLTLLLSTRLAAIAAGAIAVVAFGVAWMLGVLGGIGAFLGVDQLAGVAAVSRWIFPSDGMWRGAINALQPPFAELLAGGRSGFAEANPFYAASPPAPLYLAWAALWVVGLVGLAVWSFGRRDL
jgi:ABC-type transport system involved in multi-copper enzyme maturation permease subunit